MFDYVRGTVVHHGVGAVVLDAGGIGYRFAVSDSTLAGTPREGETRLFAHHVLRDDRAELFGFADEGERHLFRQLLQVGGVGPAVALALLSKHRPEALASHIAGGDLPRLTSVKGVGRRTGERILVELRDRLQKVPGAAAAGAAPEADAIMALCSLGIPRAEAERRVAAVEGDGLAIEEIVKQALKPVR